MISPCIGICSIRGGVCRGCGRTPEQIQCWTEMTDDERREVMGQDSGMDVAPSWLELKEENDALAAQLQGPNGFATWKDAAIDERVRRVAAEKRERALAAYVEALKGAMRPMSRLCADQHWENFHRVFDEAPDTSLARRDEEQFRKGFWWGFERARGFPDRHNIEAEWSEVRGLRRQAEGGK